MIKEEKEILFGAFSDKVTKELKINKWTNICEKAKSLGLVAAGKKFPYIRDTFWPNIKNSINN